jgi:hypothetical protein
VRISDKVIALIEWNPMTPALQGLRLHYIIDLVKVVGIKGDDLETNQDGRSKINRFGDDSRKQV